MRSHYKPIALMLTLALVLTLISSTAMAGLFGKGRGIKGSGDMETRELDLKTFEAIEISGAFDVFVTFGSKQRVEVTIDDNLWDIFVGEVSRGTLELGWDENCRPDRDCRVEIVVAELKELEIGGAGAVEVTDFDGDEFTFILHGAADLEIDGKVDDLEIQISGAGDVDARELIARNVNVRISGAGNATVYASESISGRISGVGNLSYYGDPEDRDTHVSGIGRIKRK